MTGQRLFELLSDLPDDLIAEADAPRPARRKSPVLQWSALAACTALVILLGSFALNSGGYKSAAPIESPAAQDSALAESESAAKPEAAPGESASPETDYGLVDTAPPTAGGAEESPTDTTADTNPGTPDVPGFWNAYSLTSEVVTLYVPSEGGWAATTVTDEVSIKGIYTRLFISDPEVLPALSSRAVSVLVDLQNGFAFTLYADAAGEATLYTVPDEAALTEALEAGDDPWALLTETDRAVRYSTDLDAFVTELLPQ